MTFTSIGDLSRSFQSARQTYEVKTDLQRLSQELASGRKSNLSSTMMGDFLPLIGLDRSISALQAHETVSAEARLFAETMQASLGQIQTHSETLAPALLTAASSSGSSVIEIASVDAFSRFESVVAAFNTRIADRYAFSGVSVSSPPLADAQTMLDDILLAVAGMADAASIETAVDTWFDTTGGGFETIGYIGSTDRLAPMRIAPDESIDLSMTAADVEVREVLKGFALAALVGEGVLSTNFDERVALTRAAGTQLISSQFDLSKIRANVGTAEARIETAAARADTQKSLFEMARADLISADPFETATKLEEVRSQLDTIFTITARLSELSLTNYLR